jgi:prepilin-type N-terminal cleavage/methylation domain-containing protein
MPISSSSARSDAHPRRPLTAVGESVPPRGFTLIELAVTLMVLAICAALIAPSVGRGLNGLRSRAEISGFVGFLRAAREQAVTRGLAQQVRLEPETLTLVISPEGSPSVRASRSFSYLIRIEADPPAARTITFQPQGLSSGGRFHILAPGERHYVVTVDPLTGRVVSRLADS